MPRGQYILLLQHTQEDNNHHAIQAQLFSTVLITMDESLLRKVHTALPKSNIVIDSGAQTHVWGWWVGEVEGRWWIDEGEGGRGRWRGGGGTHLQSVVVAAERSRLHGPILC